MVELFEFKGASVSEALFFEKKRNLLVSLAY